jgi:hypothetical protein
MAAKCVENRVKTNIRRAKNVNEERRAKYENACKKAIEQKMRTDRTERANDKQKIETIDSETRRL